MGNNKELTLKEIKKLIPHREPMLLIDKVKVVKHFEKAIGEKKIKNNDYYFKGHFPNKPIMPGVFIIEALAQTASVLVMHSLKKTADNKLVYFMSLENAKFRKPVMPNSKLYLYVKKKQHRGKVWKFSGEAKVNNVKVAEAIYSAMIVE
ncbi:MAG: 3-hydroxyacyl-ACP dehydratase FabZ [Alphaproteobacteria bacterium]|nr:3-hydroxyacyl-ACP dehydratase FabZ [Alphaproteobacteria bacterium]|tara:strand:- start:182 stop:628 length:447 start_codon:yes stop_codon:yes gene_type:complete